MRNHVSTGEPKNAAPVDFLRQTRFEAIRARLFDPVSEREAVVTLAVTAWLSFMLWVLMLVRPFSLLAYYRYNQLSLFGFSWVNPLARWDMLGALGLEGLLYWVGWRAARRARGRAAWMIVIWGALASGLALLFVYPLGSTDIFDYIVHGRMVGIYGANPFVQTGYDFPRDLFFPYMGWPGASSAYGPVWEIMAGITARLAGNGIIANVLAFKALNGLFLAGSIGMVAAILRRMRSAERAGDGDGLGGPAHDNVLAGVLLLAWNPIVLYETLANGHNDIVMMFWVLVAAWMLLNRRFTLTMLALLMGILVKFMPALLLPAAGLIALRELPGMRARVRFVLTIALVGGALLALAYAPFWQGPSVLGVARRQQLFTTSLPSLIYIWLTPSLGADRAGALVSRAAWMLTLLFALWQGVCAWRDRTVHSFVVSAFSTFMFYLMVTVLWFMPWYALWPLSLAPMLPRGRFVRLAQIFGFAASFQPMLMAPILLWGIPPSPNWQQLGLASATLTAPGLYALFMRLGGGG
jgi:hypothetical protein